MNLWTDVFLKKIAFYAASPPSKRNSRIFPHFYVKCRLSHRYNYFFICFAVRKLNDDLTVLIIWFCKVQVSWHFNDYKENLSAINANLPIRSKEHERHTALHILFAWKNEHFWPSVKRVKFHYIQVFMQHDYGDWGNVCLLKRFRRVRTSADTLWVPILLNPASAINIYSHYSKRNRLHMTTFRTQYIVSCHNKLLMKFFLAWAVLSNKA